MSLRETLERALIQAHYCNDAYLVGLLKLAVLYSRMTEQPE